MNIQALADFLESVKGEISPMIDILDCTHWCITEDQTLLMKDDEIYSWEINEGSIGEGDFTIFNLDMHSKYGFTAVLHNACRLSEDEFNVKYHKEF